jgi:hypothetical protein
VAVGQATAAKWARSPRSARPSVADARADQSRRIPMALDRTTYNAADTAVSLREAGYSAILMPRGGS